MGGRDDALLRLGAKGLEHIATIEKEMRDWLIEHEYKSVEQLKGSMSQEELSGAGRFERAAK